MQFFNEVSSRDWDAIKNNGLFSKKYLATCTQSSLEQAFDKRVRDVCNRYRLSPPKKIIVSSWKTEIVPGELQVFPIDFLACNLTKDKMTPEHQLMYKQIDEFIEKMNNASLKTEKDKEFSERKKIFTEYKGKLSESLEKYKNVLNGNELNYRIACDLMTNQFLSPFSVFESQTARKICTFVVPVFSALTAAWITHKRGANNLLTGSAMLVTGGITAVNSKKIKDVAKMVFGGFLFLTSFSKLLKFDQDVRKDQKIHREAIRSLFMQEWGSPSSSLK